MSLRGASKRLGRAPHEIVKLTPTKPVQIVAQALEAVRFARPASIPTRTDGAARSDAPNRRRAMEHILCGAARRGNRYALSACLSRPATQWWTCRRPSACTVGSEGRAPATSPCPRGTSESTLTPSARGEARHSRGPAPEVAFLAKPKTRDGSVPLRADLLRRPICRWGRPDRPHRLQIERSLERWEGVQKPGGLRTIQQAGGHGRPRVGYGLLPLQCQHIWKVKRLHAERRRHRGGPAALATVVAGAPSALVAERERWPSPGGSPWLKPLPAQQLHLCRVGAAVSTRGQSRWNARLLVRYFDQEGLRDELDQRRPPRTGALLEALTARHDVCPRGHGLDRRKSN